MNDKEREQKRQEMQAQGVTWDIFENAWVTVEYWEWVNGR